jgi:RimJ/RimL family protein N-acetyltransferase
MLNTDMQRTNVEAELHSTEIVLPVTLQNGVNLLLRRVTQSDQVKLVKACEDPPIAVYMGSEAPVTWEKAQSFVRKAEEKHRNRKGNEFVAEVAEQDRTKVPYMLQDALWGCVGFCINEQKPSEAEVSYWVNADARRQNVGSSMLTALETHLEDLGVNTFVAKTAVMNKASEKLLLRNGYTQIDVLEKGMIVRDYHDVLTGVQPPAKIHVDMVLWEKRT